MNPILPRSLMARLARRLLPTAVVSALLLAGGLIDAPRAAEQDVVTAGIIRNFPPQYFLDDDGKPQGLGVDLMGEIARRAGFSVRFKVYNNGRDVVRAIATGEVDLTATLGITPDRAALFDFSLPLETFRVSLFVREGSKGIGGLEDLVGQRIAVVKANSAERLLRARPELTLKIYLTVEEALFSLLSGNTEALAFPEPILTKVARGARVEERIREVGAPLLEIKRAVAITRGRPDLLERVNAVIPAFIATATYRDLYTKWYGGAPPYWTGPRVALVTAAAIGASGLVMFAWYWWSLLRVNRRLRLEVTERQRAERAVGEARDNLEVQVLRRTEELHGTNALLRQEVDERRRAEEELRRAQESLVRSERLATLGQLTATVSHELRNPLGVIHNSMHTIRGRLGASASDLTRPMERIDRNVQRCTTIVEDMLEFARLQEPALQPLAVDSWLSDLLNDYTPALGIDLHPRLQARAAQVLLDPERMRRVLINLLDNACQAMRTESGADTGANTGAKALTLTTELQAGAVVVRIEDSGSGLTADAAEHLFEPLFSTKSFGVGLGLSIVRKIVDAHGGTIQIANRQDSPGAVATLTLPVAPN